MVKARARSRALLGHALLTIRLNFRSGQSLVYGYLVPVLFLLAFGSIFRGEDPLLLPQMGQILTITVLGGACFGLPTGIVAERERGVWRRYRLLPVGPRSLIVSALMARLLIVASAAAIQLVLAHSIYGTPWPARSFETLLAFLFVAGSFLGWGLLIAALADDVPAVQALGQCLFLPMILIGGVGVPLAALPGWAQFVSGFMPGRYAVEVLQRAFAGSGTLRDSAFALLALGGIGVAAAWVGVKLFRWDSERRVERRDWATAVLALSAWLAVGTLATATGRLAPAGGHLDSYQQIDDAQLATIGYDDLPGDNELVTRLAPPLAPEKVTGRLAEFRASLRDWPPGRVANPGQAVRNLLSIAAIADINADLLEAEIARSVFDELQARFKGPELRRSLGWVVLYPDSGAVLTSAPELGFRRPCQEPVVRERTLLYAKKLLGRLQGILAEQTTLATRHAPGGRESPSELRP